MSGGNESPDHRCPYCGGSPGFTGEKTRIQGETGGHHLRVYECGNCGREVKR